MQSDSDILEFSDTASKFKLYCECSGTDSLWLTCGRIRILCLDLVQELSENNMDTNETVTKY